MAQVTDRGSVFVHADDPHTWLAQPEQAGITATPAPSWDGPHGRFAPIQDPDGTPVALWQAPEVPAT